MRLGEVLESPERLVVPFWNWSSISVEGSDLDSRVVLNETGDTDHNCPDFVTVPYNFTVLLTAGCTVGVLVALYILFRAYRLLFITYCVSLLPRRGAPIQPGQHGRLSVYVISSSLVDSATSFGDVSGWSGGWAADRSSSDWEIAGLAV